MELVLQKVLLAGDLKGKPQAHIGIGTAGVLNRNHLVHRIADRLRPQFRLLAGDSLLREHAGEQGVMILEVLQLAFRAPFLFDQFNFNAAKRHDIYVGIRIGQVRKGRPDRYKQYQTDNQSLH